MDPVAGTGPGDDRRLLVADRLVLLHEDAVAREAAILVEGRKDTRALHRLGFTAPIIELNRGGSLVARVDTIACEHGGIVLLFDWDRKGRELLARMGDMLRLVCSEVIDIHWRKLEELLAGEVSVVEGLFSYLEDIWERDHASRLTGKIP